MFAGNVYGPPSYMSVRQCIDQLIELEKECRAGVCDATAQCVGVARIGADDQVMAHEVFRCTCKLDAS